jgi:hypothetical protein
MMFRGSSLRAVLAVACSGKALFSQTHSFIHACLRCPRHVVRGWGSSPCVVALPFVFSIIITFQRGKRALWVRCWLLLLWAMTIPGVAGSSCFTM